MYLCMMGGYSFYVSVGYFEYEFMTINPVHTNKL